MPGAYNSDVDVTVEAAFGHDPLATPTWTDISTFCRGFSIRRGRSRMLDDMQASMATIVLDNTDSRFNPDNTSGAYTPNVRVTTPIRIRATHNLTTYDLFRGFVEAWPQSYPVKKDAVAVVKAVDAFKLFAQFEAETTKAQGLSGTRIGLLLDDVGWPAGWRDIDTGNHNVAAITSEFNSVLGEIKRAVLVESGLFWIAGTGDATFRDGDTRFEDTTIQATFSDDGADSEYTNIQIDYDDSQLWNKAVVTRVDGTAQTSSDATSIGDYGERDLHLSETLHVSDGEASALADWLVDEFKDIRLRVSAITITPEGDPAQLWPEALSLELLDKVNVERTPPSSSVIDQNCFIEGIAHNVTMVGRRSWTTTFQLSPELPHTDWWVLGTSALDTDTRLGY